jgi:hypothetical protein
MEKVEDWLEKLCRESEGLKERSENKKSFYLNDFYLVFLNTM